MAYQPSEQGDEGSSLSDSYPTASCIPHIFLASFTPSLFLRYVQ
jgi:hypothetical protein